MADPLTRTSSNRTGCHYLPPGSQIRHGRNFELFSSAARETLIISKRKGIRPRGSRARALHAANSYSQYRKQDSTVLASYEFLAPGTHGSSLHSRKFSSGRAASRERYNDTRVGSTDIRHDRFCIGTYVRTYVQCAGTRAQPVRPGEKSRA